jgi:hypothetical protein
MDNVLVSITGIALVLAVAMGVMVFRLLREERQRSDARVTLLTAATGAGSVEPLTLFDADLQAVSDADAHSLNGLFAAPSAESPWKRRLAVVSGLAVMIVIAGYALNSRTPQPQTSAAQQPVRQPVPLELLALRHAQAPGSLTITGVVQNPRSGVAISHVTAVAFLFGSDGALVASGRADLDYSTLDPGAESPFVIKVPVSGTVTRYRVGFRAADGSVIAHVDRRADGTAASNERRTGNASWVR